MTKTKKTKKTEKTKRYGHIQAQATVLMQEALEEAIEAGDEHAAQGIRYGIELGLKEQLEAIRREIKAGREIAPETCRRCGALLVGVEEKERRTCNQCFMTM